LIGVEGGDSSGNSETAKTLQERSDEAAWRSPHRKASARNGNQG
jgi:hypothetical protein